MRVWWHFEIDLRCDIDWFVDTEEGAEGLGGFVQFQQSIFKWPIYMEADGRDYKRRYVGNLWSLDDTFVFHRFCFASWWGLQWGPRRRNQRRSFNRTSTAAFLLCYQPAASSTRSKDSHSYVHSTALVPQPSSCAGTSLITSSRSNQQQR